MMPIAEIIAKVSQGPRDSKDLTWSEAKAVMKGVVEGQVTPFQLGALAVGLRIKVESVTELAAFASAARDYLSAAPFSDKSGLLDVPTYARERTSRSMLVPAAMIAVACDVPVLMHGCEPHGSSWNTGSLLRALGIQVDAQVGTVSDMVRKTGFGYLDIGMFHPPMNRYLDLAEELGLTSFFYPIARLLNPGRATRHLIGMAAGPYFDKLGETLRMLGCEHGLIIQGPDGEPELSMVRLLRTLEVNASMSRPHSMRPADFALPSGTAGDFAAKDVQTEAADIERLLKNEITGIQAEGAVLNAATMLYLGGKAATIQDGIPIARESLRSGAAHGAFVRIRDFQLSVASNAR
ncbi:MAG TPA: hypothetical protein EYN18_09120 [Nitrospirales bacterium]|nr:hypothetical protein [Nitrospirales bacterium]HIC04051.1 hypothetical protein [Nitrospirales bacterium]HIO22533.1 hypothetical protein [Nitrospirales bacterium]